MSISDDLLKKTEARIRRQEMPTPEYDAVWKSNRRSKLDESAEKIIAPAPPANLVITRPESFSFQEIEGFFFKKNISSKAVELEKQNPFQDVQSSNNAGNVVQTTASQFNNVNGAGVLFASNGAPESLSDKSGEMRSLLQQNNWSRRPLMA